MLKFLKSLFKSRNERELMRLQSYVDRINSLAVEIESLHDEELKEKTFIFRDRLKKGETLDDILCEAFAVVRETADRRVGQWKIFSFPERELGFLKDREFSKEILEIREKLPSEIIYLPASFYQKVRKLNRNDLRFRPFDVQVIGGIVLHEGNIAEMQTGEGKTLAATMPVYLNALTGRGVHVVTVNDYLAKRDVGWMGPIYHALGLSSAALAHEISYEYDPLHKNLQVLDHRLEHLKIIKRNEAYRADITYGTNSEFGFDYLRDNMAIRKEDIVQRGHYYAIIDEVDSILIDEARTPHIISGPAEKPTKLYYKFASLVNRLKMNEDFEVDEKVRTVTLTESGISKVEKQLNIKNLYHPDNEEINHHLHQALKAAYIFKKDRDYVVKNGKVIIVDEFTGRLMFGRRYSQGLHQAIEAKEGVKIEQENQTLATITLQNYFRLYEKIAGMTGTAFTEAKEFKHIYGLDVVVIPTNLPMIRVDYPDVIYKTNKEKFKAIVEEIVEYHRRSQPVLVGTISIENSELLARMLKKRGIKCNVLNAKYHEKEAQIIAEAGRSGAVTIATNMAGRGTDIVLDRKVLNSDCRHPETDQVWCCVNCTRPERKNGCRNCFKYDKKDNFINCKNKVLCGLHVIGTERHEARRIDNQLRGRSGRQGDPGSSRFYLSLEDDLMRLFGSDTIAKAMDRLGIEEDQPIEHRLVSKAVEHAQKRVESRNFNIRKHILEFDNVMNQQREVVYDSRLKVLFDRDLKKTIFSMTRDIIDDNMNLYLNKELYEEQWDLETFIKRMNHYFGLGLGVASIKGMSREEIRDYIQQKAEERYSKLNREIGEEQMKEIEKMHMLRVIDHRWKEHLLAMDSLEEGINLRAYGQRDPLIEYKMEGFSLFENMINLIKKEVIIPLFRLQPPESAEPEKQKDTLEAKTNLNSNRNKPEPEKKAVPVTQNRKIKPNAPCPCGSGKKYKKCCGKEEK